MKITICDDSIQDLMKAEKMLVDFTRENPQGEYEIELFSDSNKLYKKLQEGEISDIYILDMLMPIKSGIDLGKQVRKLDKEKPIIYMTTSEEFALDAYKVQAARYLVKPFDKKQFYEALEHCIACISRKDEQMYIIKTQEGILSLPVSKIMYIEHKSRILYAHLSDERIIKSLFIRSSFESEVSQLLESSTFILVHKSFLVNLRHVEKLAAGSVTLTCGQDIPVSKKKYAEVKRKYLLFMVDRYR